MNEETPVLILIDDVVVFDAKRLDAVMFVVVVFVLVMLVVNKLEFEIVGAISLNVFTFTELIVDALNCCVMSVWKLVGASISKSAVEMIRLSVVCSSVCETF